MVTPVLEEDACLPRSTPLLESNPKPFMSWKKRSFYETKDGIGEAATEIFA
jgi:hypothetical protein